MAIEAHVTVRFSDPINLTSLTSDTLVLAAPPGALATRLLIPAENGRLAFVWPVDRLFENTTYTLIVSGAVDRARVPVTPASIVFTTKRLGDAPASPSNDDWTPNASWRTNRAPSPWQQLPTLMAPPGVTALSGQVLKLNGERLADVRPPHEPDVHAGADHPDRCYMEHDKCYEKCSDHRRCDQQLLRCLHDLPWDPRNWPEPPRAGTMLDTLRFMMYGS